MNKRYLKPIKELGARIKSLRKSKGLTQTQLADLCDTDIRVIQKIEAGGNNTGICLLLAISDALEIEPRDLFIM